jgi:hypothetical protein
VRRALSVTLYIAVMAGMAVAAVDAGRLVWAEWLATTNTGESLTEAVRIDPGNATFHGLLAEHQEASGKDPKPELKTAASLSPAESRYWARLAFRAETERDDDAAEKYLLHAAEVDRTFAPRWALANFYLRRGDAARGDMDKFWVWLRKSFEMPPPEVGALFQVAWAVSHDGDKIRAIVPDDPAILRQYVGWLVENRPVGDAEGPALELAAKSVADDVPVLLGFCEKTSQMDMPRAVEAWNLLCRRKLLPYTALDPKAGHIVSNESFSIPPLQRGFDWTLFREPGVSQAMAETGSGLVIQFSGKQGERTGLFQQSVPLAAGKRYRLSFEYRVSGQGGPTGLHWELLRTPGNSNLLTDPPAMRGTDWTTGQGTFESSDESFARLLLVYQREPGMVPWEGTLYLRKVGIEALP